MNFSTWLAQQTGRDGPIGDLAKDAERDPGRPNARKKYRGWVEYLEAKDAPHETFDAFRHAWQEWSQVYKPGLFGLPSMFDRHEWPQLVDVMEAEGATFSYDEYGERSRWTYPPEDKPRIEAAVQAWWKAGNVYQGYSAESRQLLEDRDKERGKAEQAARLAEQRRLQRAKR